LVPCSRSRSWSASLSLARMSWWRACHLAPPRMSGCNQTPNPSPTERKSIVATEPASPIQKGPASRLRAARGVRLRARNWRAEALLRMFENVLEVGENPAELIVYASLGKAARSWEQARAIATALLDLREDQTLILQSGAAIGVLDTHPGAPMVISAVNNTVGRWSGSDLFYERMAAGQTMWGGLTAGAWQYIGRQGVLQGTYELLRTI